MSPSRLSLSTCVVSASLAAMSACTASAADRVGVREVTIATKEPGRSLPTLVLYPAATGGTQIQLGENAVIFGTEAWRDAAPDTGKHPLIVVSHGSGGNAAGLGWLTVKLASLGYIVAVPNHPGTTSGDSDQKRTVELWHRPMDLTATVDALTSDAALSATIDPDKIGALGFSLGGYDVLALAGAEQRRKSFAYYCNANVRMQGCDWLRKGGVDFAALDPRFEANHRNPRFKAIVAVDPAFTPSYDEASLRAVSVPLQILNLGTPATTPSIVEGRWLADTIPRAQLSRVPDAMHFSFLGVCKPDGARLLEAEGDDPICADAGSRDRPALHAEMLKVISGFLQGALPVTGTH